MLQDIRDRTTGPVAWIIVALLSVPFALWGINSYFQGGSGGGDSVAKVGGQSITKYQLQRAYNQRFRRLRQMMGQHFDPDIIKPQVLRIQALQSLIQRSLLVQYAQDHGYRVSDRSVLAHLKQTPAFQENGTFSSKRYRQVLKRSGMQPAQYEARIRQALLIQQLRSGITSSTVVTQARIDQAYRLQHERRSLSYLVFHADHYRDRVSISDKEIKNYYQSHSSQFTLPQQVKLAYVDLNQSDLKPDQPPSKKDLKALYESEKSQFSSPGKRRARHILIKVNKDESGKEARAKAQKIRKKMENGASFADMAKKYSQDAGTNQKGGELGWLGRHALPEPFEKALFNLKQGAVSQPVRTRYGWHLIKLQAIRPARTKAFSDPSVQKKLKKQYRRKAASKRFKNKSQTLAKISFENPDALKPVARKLGLKVQQTGWITQKGEHKGLVDHGDVIKAAFSDQVLKMGLNSKPIELSDGRQVVVRLADRKKTRTKPLQKVKGQIKQALSKQQIVHMARGKADEALSEARKGQSLHALAKDIPGTSLKNPGYVSRQESGVNTAILSRVFSMPLPGHKKDATYESVSLDDGDTAVLALDDIQYGDPSRANREERKKLRKSLAQQQGRAAFASYMDSIREEYKVKVLDKKLAKNVS